MLGFRRHQEARTILLLGIPVLVTLTTVVVYGGTRMRSAAESPLAVLAALGLVAALHGARQRWARFHVRATPAGSLTPQ